VTEYLEVAGKLRNIVSERGGLDLDSMAILHGAESIEILVKALALAEEWLPVSTIGDVRDGRKIMVCLAKVNRNNRLGPIRLVHWNLNPRWSPHWLGDVAGHYFHDHDFAAWRHLPKPPKQGA
jgi:hypothetical protein